MSLSEFSERLKWLMEMEGISRRALSVQTNVQRKSLLNWLNGEFYPRYDALIRLSDFFKVKTDYLLALEGYDDRVMSAKRCPIEVVPMQFREKLNCFIKESGMTKYGLAKKLEIGQTTLERWFSCGAMPDTAGLIRLAKVMEESVDFLLGRE